LLDFLFSELSSISKQTALLESLAWSEERLEEVLEICSSSISEMSLSPIDYSSPDKFRDRIVNDLRDILSESQIESVLDILNDIIAQNIEGVTSDGN
jgi:hypothetical protein